MSARAACRHGLCRAAGEPAPRPVVVAWVPANARALVAVDPARRERLRAHLEAIATEAAEERRREPDDLSFLDDPLFAKVCAVCAGACCLRGGERAYLDARTLARFFDEHPGADLAAATDAYLAHVPARAYDGSCLFHGEHGCTLPRAMRAEPCRTYDCAGLRDVVSTLAAEREDRALVVAADEARVVRLAIVGDGGARGVDLAERTSRPTFVAATK